MLIWTVDAFAKEPYTGNPAAVTIVKKFPTDKQCLEIAAEMNLSETAFVLPLRENNFHIRWFTSVVEMELCGHATLATAHILFQENMVPDVKGRIQFKSLGGSLYAFKDKSGITLDFPLQKVGPPMNSRPYQEWFGIHIVNTVRSFDTLIFELDGEEKVREFNPDFVGIRELEYSGLIVTSRSAPPYDFISRYFAPKLGIPEDPVTGTAHCKLADYWHKRLGKEKMLAYQASPRGGEVKIELHGERVYLTGGAVTVMQGQWVANL